MTDEQRELARHALGLNSRHKRSYRNRFVVESTAPDGREWMMMCGERMGATPGSLYATVRRMRSLLAHTNWSKACSQSWGITRS